MKANRKKALGQYKGIVLLPIGEARGPSRSRINCWHLTCGFWWEQRFSDTRGHHTQAENGTEGNVKGPQLSKGEEGRGLREHKIEDALTKPPGHRLLSHPWAASWGCWECNWQDSLRWWGCGNKQRPPEWAQRLFPEFAVARGSAIITCVCQKLRGRQEKGELYSEK